MIKATFFKPLILSLGIGALLSPYAYADNFIQPNPNPKKQITPLTDFDKSLQKEMNKYPKGTAFIINAKTGKIIATKPPQSTKSTKKPKTPPYNMSEEYIELL